ncbi:ATPase [Paenibacillus sp. R14(2021)]|uniref:ATPase n=1 Tax=Paenibacillus sp. R14(2021) TaxID=2859228 RepID=UPI001C613F7F|nr:ATPase [Paenibacillus sp. R14(2021)]
MYKLGQRIVILSDVFEQSLPVGEYGYIIAYDRNADNAFDYVIRVPKANRNFYVPAGDIELEAVLIQMEVDRLEREALIDFALATHNAELFHRIMNGDQGEEEEESGSGEPQTREDFMRQVRLKAWI